MENDDILLKDSIYAAIGLAAPILEHHADFDFGHFLDNTLVQEVQVSRSGYNILRRRAAVLLGQWLPVKETLNRPLVYRIFQHLLDKDDQLNDLVVRVTAGRQLSNVVEPFEFDAEIFMPYVTNILGRLISLIEEVELSETKLALLDTIRVVVIHMEQHVCRYKEEHHRMALIIPDLPMFRPNHLASAFPLGKSWRRVPHETVHPWRTVSVSHVDAGRIPEISFINHSFDPIVHRARF